MKMMKKLMLAILLIFAMFISASFSVSATNMIPIPKYGGGYITYRNTSTQIKMPENYIEPASNFRAVWVSNVVNDISTYSNESQYKEEMMRVFDTMEYYNMNAIIFHIRTHHDAMYRSELNRLSTNYTGVDFDEFDPLAWIIEESHRRGIEFHAWMNPYRIGGGTIESVAAKFPASNPASKTENLLSGAQNIILNPGSPEVREFLIDTVMEVVQNYDVDAIHFDDYFYESGVDDYATRQKYNPGLSVANFRRLQVDTFINDLHTELENFNGVRGKNVQLGISPSGIYNNGSYVPATNYTYNPDGSLKSPLGSNSSGYSHYDSPLYADTLKWINNEWIDYIVPQVYWSFDNGVAPFGDIVEWWNGALKNSNVNLYLGTALYTAGVKKANAVEGVGWEKDTREFANQVQYASGLANVHGQVIFSFSQLYSSLKSSSVLYYQNMHNVKNEMWYKDALLPEIRTMDPVNLSAVTGFELSKTSAGYRIDFNKLDNAKSYAVYRSKTPLTYAASELIEVIGKKEIAGKVSYIDNISTTQNYYYGIKAISSTNTPGAPVSLSTTGVGNGELITVGNLSEIEVGGATFFNTSVTLKWEKVLPNFGDEVKYAIYTSTDGVNFQKSNTAITASGNYYSTEVLLGDKAKFYVYMNVKNNISTQDSKIYEIDVVENIGPINNFTYTGNSSAGEVITFKWNIIEDNEGTVYKVQTSSNQVTWRDLPGTINLEGNNASMSYMLPIHYSNNYYRVIASNSRGKGYSKLDNDGNNLRIQSLETIGKINIKYKIDSNTDLLSITGPITVNQNSSIEFIWNNISHSSGDVSYRANVSHNLKTWKVAKAYDQGNILKYYDSEGKTGHTINATFEYYILYIQIEAYTATANSKSEIIEVRVVPSTMLQRVVLENYYYQHQTIINKTNIFK